MQSKEQITPAELSFSANQNTAFCRGAWNLAGITNLRSYLKHLVWPSKKELVIDGSQIVAMDMAGAWELYKLLTQLKHNNFTIELQGFRPEHKNLLSLIKTGTTGLTPLAPLPRENWLARLGRRSILELKELTSFLTFTGELTIVALRSLRDRNRIHWRPLMWVIETTGFQALPIIALLSFMIGVVLAYQMGIQLRNYGADIFIVDLTGAAVFREFGCLITAIMVAGRTGSAFTAQLGTMKLNEEIDALRTMGILPNELLILPRLLGLFIALPLLTMWADIFGVLGGMLMAKGMLSITYHDFIIRFRQQVSLGSLLIGLGKAPVFALIIAGIGCFQGMRVEGGAESVGRQTTRSVVQAIFIIIIVDAIFSILFSKFDL